jgi:hypothetical protein
MRIPGDGLLDGVVDREAIGGRPPGPYDAFPVGEEKRAYLLQGALVAE